jgi:anti-anti-sigma factor
MATHAEANGERAFIAIEGEFTIYTVAQWKCRLFTRLAANRNLDLDLSGVGEIDTAGQQLLIAVKLHAMAIGGSLRVTAHSPAVVEVLDLCRLGSFFGDPVLIPKAA